MNIHVHPSRIFLFQLEFARACAFDCQAFVNTVRFRWVAAFAFCSVRIDPSCLLKSRASFVLSMTTSKIAWGQPLPAIQGAVTPQISMHRDGYNSCNNVGND